MSKEPKPYEAPSVEEIDAQGPILTTPGVISPPK